MTIVVGLVGIMLGMLIGFLCAYVVMYKEPKGVFQHFKGGYYNLIGEGISSEDKTQEFVIDESQEDGQWWIRPKEMFYDTIKREGMIGPMPRFRRIN